MRVRRQTAFLRGGMWRCSDSRLENELNELTRKWIQATGGPPIEDRNHEMTAAKRVVALLGGRVCGHVKPSLKKSADIYISQRQLDLDFAGDVETVNPLAEDSDRGPT